jgi:hypothetical protein
MDSTLILLNLLKGYARGVPEGGLAHAQEDAPLAQAGCDVNVYGMASQGSVCLQSCGQRTARITYNYLST